MLGAVVTVPRLLYDYVTSKNAVNEGPENKNREQKLVYSEVRAC